MEGERQLRRRVFILTVIFAGSVGFLILYLFYLQIVRGMEFSQKAKDVSQREQPIFAQRGEIFDRTVDTPLVFNVDSFAVDVIPGEVGAAEIQNVLERLSTVLSVPVSELEKRLPPKSYSLFQPVEVKGGVSLQTISYLAEHLDEFNGVTWHNKPIRNYVESGTLAHVIGYVGNITTEDLQVLYNQGYTIGSVVGQSGIEKQYDAVLRGNDGKKYRVVDVQERSLAGEESDVVPPEDGLNVVLTIDRNIQRIAQQALGERRGSVIVLKPATGEILALVSYPTFDPNRLFQTDAGQYFTALTLDPASPFLNRAIQSSYPPASAFKMVMTTAVVDDATIPIARAVLCTGKFPFGDRVFNCHVKTGHGYLDLLGGLAQSCDVYFYTMGNELGIEKIDSYAREFGVGSLTGIDLPQERSGLLPTPEWKQKEKHMKWVGGDTINMSIGQGFVAVTPLQMANIVAMIANSGTVYRPYLLKETREPDTGKTVSTTKPEVIHTSHIGAETFRTVQEAMRGVITKGTAAPVVNTKAVEIAGKTGTGESGVDGQWHSWFAAYAPYTTNQPEDRVVVVVMVEASENWEWWGPKAANLIFHCIFAKQSFDEAVAALKPWYIKVKPRAE